ncbi:MAG: sigma-54 dependent transcriptional regulator [Anaerolineaceae bacterium]
MSLTVLIVDDEENARQFLGELLATKSYNVIGVGTLSEARDHLMKGDADIVLLDIQLPDGYGPNLLYETSSMPSRPPIIMITGFGDIETAVDAMKNGAHDFLTKPVDFAQLEKSLQRAGEVVTMRRELEHYREAMSQKVDFVVGESPRMKTVIAHALKAADAQVSVLITGETGTGKDVLAQYIHASGPRANKPFIAINCAAIQNTMLESELFGYEAGAFTSAERRKPGLMEVADGGILFLDEISSMSLDIQAKLLRAIESQSFRRVGGTNLIKVDVQIVAASNRDLPKMIRENQFREDLFYRLNIVDLNMAPLRERKEDIPELVGFFLRATNMRKGRNVTEVTPLAMEAMQRYDWPGNIRELSNAIERAVIFCDGRSIDLPDLPRDVSMPHS